MGGIYFVHVGDTLASRVILDSHAFGRRRGNSHEISQTVTREDQMGVRGGFVMSVIPSEPEESTASITPTLILCRSQVTIIGAWSIRDETRTTHNIRLHDAAGRVKSCLLSSISTAAFHSASSTIATLKWFVLPRRSEERQALWR